MDMVNTASKLMETAGRTMDMCKRRIGEEIIDDKGFDSDTLEMLRGLFDVVDLAMQLTYAQAKIIDSMNCKLDRLLEKTK